MTVFDTPHPKPLGSTVLSLLVAADQRCPAIIGQAHLLYHARMASKAEEVDKIFTQLKREATDLNAAIAEVDLALAERKRKESHAASSTS